MVAVPSEAGSAPLSSALALIAILKGTIGAGILSLPFAFQEVGLLFGTAGFLVVSSLCTFSVWRLIQCKSMLSQPIAVNSAGEELAVQSEGPEGSDYGLGPAVLVSSVVLGWPGALLTGAGIIIAQVGIGVAYIDVVVVTLKGPRLLGNHMSVGSLRVLTAGVLCFLGIAGDMKSIAKVSGVAMLVYAYLLVALIKHGSEELHDNGVQFENEIHWDKFGPWFGTCIFAQEAIIIVQCIYEDMKLTNKNDFIPVLLSSASICAVLCLFVAVFAAMCYGSEVKSVFYLNFPKSSLDVQIVEIVLCIVLLLTFALQLYPVNCFLKALILPDADAITSQREVDGAEAEAKEDEYEDDDEDENGCSIFADCAPDDDEDEDSSATSDSFSMCSTMSAICLRWGVVIASSFIAVAISDVTRIMGLAGSFGISVVGFLSPALCHIKLCNCRMSICDWVLDLLLIATGVLAIVTGIANSF